MDLSAFPFKGGFMKFFFLLVFGYFPLSASLVGNPSLPRLYRKGLLWEEGKSISLRAEYVADYIYSASFREDVIEENAQTSTIQFSTYAVSGIINFFQKIDCYGLVGSSKLEVAEELYAPRRFCWGIGAKAVFYQKENFLVGGDIKYFYSKQRPLYFLLEKTPATILSSFSLEYSEIQGAFTASYHWKNLIPYLGVTYLEARIAPSPSSGLIDIPLMEMILAFDSPATINHHKWGIVTGISLLSKETMTLNIESRFIDQNGINLSGEIQF